MFTCIITAIATSLLQVKTQIFYFCMCTVQKYYIKADQQNPCQGLYGKTVSKIFKINKMRKSLKSLNGKKLQTKDMISLTGGKLAYVKTMVMTVRNGQNVDDGNTDDSSWASGSNL